MPESISLEKITVDSITSLYKIRTTPDVMRLDKIHPLISGNKWFKLKYYLQEAHQLNKKFIATFGGAFSNHIVATAAASKMEGLQSIGIIRGEKPAVLCHTLIEALSLNMKLVFLSREDYKNKKLPDDFLNSSNKEALYLIPEGGYGQKGAEGSGDILKQIDFYNYTHIIAAVGTGTTIAGLTAACTEQQKVIGISVLKNAFSLQKEIELLLPQDKHQQFSLIHEYHFGGYAKHTKELIQFMNNWYLQTLIPSDFVYTGKLFFAVNNLISKNYFPDGSKILIIHSGGLQGNRSLPAGTLIF